MLQLLKDIAEAIKLVRRRRLYVVHCNKNSNKVVELYQSGMRVREIKEQLGIAPNQIYAILSKNKVKPNRGPGKRK